MHASTPILPKRLGEIRLFVPTNTLDIIQFRYWLRTPTFALCAEGL